MKKLINLFGLLSICFLASCSDNMINTWNIDKYEVIREDGKNVSYSNIGTITFEKDGHGHNNYKIEESNISDESSFRWKETEDAILIKPLKRSSNSIFAKGWIKVEEKSKSQVWKSTDGGYEIQVVNLSRK